MFFFIVLSFLFAIMVLIMPPDQAKDMENDLKHIPLIDSYGFAPALLSNQKKKSSQESSEAQRLVFYSKGIEKKKWIDQQTAIEDELNVHYLEDPDYLELLRFGRKKIVHRHYIVLIVSQGVESRREEPLYDDEP